MVRKDSAIAQVMGVTNAVTIDAEASIRSAVGPGAGGMATASSVLSDIADIARGMRLPPFGRPAARLNAVSKAPMQRHEGGYYIRLLARDKPGTAATIAKRLARAGHFAGIDRAAPRQGRRRARDQNGRRPGYPHHLRDTEDAVRKALAAVGRTGRSRAGRR